MQRLLCAVLAASCLAACQPQTDPDVLARTDHQAFTSSDLRNYVLSLPAEARVRPQSTDEQDWLQGFVRSAVVKAEIERQAQAAGVPNEAELKFATRWGITNTLATQAKRQLRQTLTLDQDAIDRQVAERLERGERRPLYSFHNIFIRTDGASNQQALENLQRLALELKTRAENEDFEALARQYSDSANATEGGAVINTAAQFLDGPIAKILEDLDDGEVSEVIQSRSGLHILRRDRRIETTPTESEIRQQVTAQVQRETIAAAEAELLTTLREKYPVLIEPDQWQIGDVVMDIEFLDRLGRSEGRLDEPRVQAQLVDLFLLAEHAREEAGLEGLEAHFEQAARQQAYLAFYEQQLNAFVNAIPSDRLRSWYDAQPSAYNTSAQSHLRLIWIPQDGDSWNATLHAEKLIEEIKAGADFTEVARRESAHESAEQGGDLGWLTPIEWAAMHPELWEAVAELDAGTISKPIYLTDRILNASPSALTGGVAVIQKVAHDPGQPRPFEQVVDEVRRAYALQKKDQIKAEFDQQLLQQAGFEVIRAPTAEELLATTAG